MNRFTIRVFVLVVMLFSALSMPGAERRSMINCRSTAWLQTSCRQTRLREQHYQILDAVTVRGNMDHYKVNSDYGFFEVTGDGLLKKRLKEIEAITVLQKIQGHGCL